MSSETVGQDMTEPPVWYFHAMVRFDGPTEAVEEWAGSARHCRQLVETFAGSFRLASFIAQTDWSVAYSLPEMVSTEVVTSPGIM